jgi:Cytochrome c7 and related cytochrome c/Class III cytochrome C family
MRVFAKLCLMASCVAAILAQTAKQPPPPPQQPIAFSHKMHAGTLELKCSQCHPNPDPGEAMNIAGASTCMQCHTEIGADRPEIQKLATAARSNREIRWTRVYQIPGDVRFSHRSHLTEGSTCNQCHGQVAERDKLFLEGDISMGACINCHKTKEASVDCTYCHQQQEARLLK